MSLNTFLCSIQEDLTMMDMCKNMMENMNPEMKKKAMGMMKKCQNMMADDSGENASEETEDNTATEKSKTTEAKPQDK